MGAQRRLLLVPAAGLGLVASLALVGVGPAQDLQAQLQKKQDRLQHARSRDGVLTTTIQAASARIDALVSQVAVLRNREAAVQQRLEVRVNGVPQDPLNYL